jgi:hypothetical protein
VEADDMEPLVDRGEGSTLVECSDTVEGETRPPTVLWDPLEVMIVPANDGSAVAAVPGDAEFRLEAGLARRPSVRVFKFKVGTGLESRVPSVSGGLGRGWMCGLENGRNVTGSRVSSRVLGVAG